MNEKVKCVLFDLDGTLLNTIGDLSAAVNYALARASLPLHTEKDVMGFVGNGVEMIMRRACPHGIREETFAGILSDFKSYYAVHSEVLTSPYPGIMKLLSELKQNGVLIGVASNKIDTVTKPLCRKYFGTLVDAAIGEREGIPKKPDPAMLLYLLRELKREPDETVYVGDSDVDLLVSKAAGIRCISCSWGFRPKEFLISSGKRILGADAIHDIVDTPEELASFLL